MRVGAPGSTRVIVGPTGQIIQSLPVQTRISGIAVAPPPPPPYPGPPPPYPGPQVRFLENFLIKNFCLTADRCRNGDRFCNSNFF